MGSKSPRECYLPIGLRLQSMEPFFFFVLVPSHGFIGGLHVFCKLSFLCHGVCWYSELYCLAGDIHTDLLNLFIPVYPPIHAPWKLGCFESTFPTLNSLEEGQNTRPQTPTLPFHLQWIFNDIFRHESFPMIQWSKKRLA